VPSRLGSESRDGSSTNRPAEAAVIVRELTAALQASADLTFGVITFYKGQEEAIWRAMSDAGLAVRLKRGHELNPSISWLRTDRGLPRVRIGTVDAFQGREFDVVYLSTTRSHEPRANKPRRFGFLVLPNRLCVAMSRQRKLLIVVGDSDMFTSDDARRSVPALAAFHDLTGGEHGFRRSA
jgi:superfamily I DNA and/or RNA helicase